jgi:hypothetical protein
MPGLPTIRRGPLSLCGALVLVLCLACGKAGAADPPLSVEFGIPYQMRLVADRTVLEVYGSFSSSLAPGFEAVIARERDLRVVRLESPGGYLLPAMQIATMIQQRGLATYVGRSCASACTVAFLGGRQRWLAPGARLGFHQARAEVGPSDQANKALRLAYEKSGVPPAFIAHVLSTPPANLWIPSPAELRAVRFTTDDPPASVLALSGGEAPKSGDLKAMLQTAPDDALVQFTAALSDAMLRLQEVNPEGCWAFAHEGHGSELNALPQTDLEAIKTAMQHLAEAPRFKRVSPPDAEQRQQAGQELVAIMRLNGQAAALEGLRPGADHAVFCPALHAMLQTALALPVERRITALRALLSGG